MRTLTAVAALSFALVVSTAERAEACSCVQPKLPDQLANSDVVFVGTAGERGEMSSVSTDGSAGPMVKFAEYTFAVERTFKGDARDSVAVRTAGNSAACGVSFQAGNRYVVYLTARDDGSLWTGLCAGNAPATPELIAQIEAELGTEPPTDPPPTDPPPVDPPPTGGNPPPVQNKGNPACGGCSSSSNRHNNGGALGGLLLLVGLLAFRRRRQ